MNRDQLTQYSAPSNASFEIDDLEEQWTFTFKFDYIHAMMMTGAFRDWPGFFKQAFEYVAQTCIRQHRFL